MTREILPAFVLGGLLVPVGLASGNPPDPATVETVAAQKFEVIAQIDAGGGPLESVQLWYTSDQGKPWKLVEPAATTLSAIPFTAPHEGLFAFYVVAQSGGGRSGPDPDATTEPHRWVFVDYTPPVVQLQSVEPAHPPTDPQTVRIRWSAIDGGFAAQPIALSYRTIPDGEWTLIDEPLANSGAYDWRVGSGIQGRVAVRLTVADRAGHVVQVDSEPLELRHAPALERQADTEAAGELPEARALTGQFPIGRDEDTWDRAQRLYRLGVKHSVHGEYHLAGARLREALALDAGLTDALVELGTVLYAQGNAPESIEAFGLALQQRPGLRAALEGLALTYIGQKRFPEAVQQLSRIVQVNPNDAEAWLNLGDVAIYQGDEMLAREHYTRAATRNPNAADTVRRARLRLAELSRLAAEFKQVE